MIPYFLLLLVPFLYNVTMQAIFNHGRIRLLENRYDYKSPIVCVFFVGLIILLVFRGRTVGLDLLNYNYMFNKYSRESIWNLFLADADIFYKILNWVIGRFTTNFQWVLVVCALITVIPIFLLYNEDKRNGYLKIAIFVTTDIFVVLFSALRQSIALSLGILAYHYVRKHKLVPFIITVFVANMFHHSAFILVAMYPIYHMRLNSKHLWMIIPAVVAVYIFREDLFVIMANVMTSFYDKYDSTMSSTGALATFLLYIVFSIFSYVLPDERKMTDELIGLRNFLVLATVMQSFAGINSLAMRMNYYYIVFIPYAMCKFIEIPKPEFRRVALVSKCVMCIFFTLYFVRDVSSAYNTKELLGIVPYQVFWR